MIVDEKKILCYNIYFWSILLFAKKKYNKERENNIFCIIISIKFFFFSISGASSEFNPGYRSQQGFNVNEFTRSLNQGMVGVLSNPSYRNNRFVPQASIIVPRAYAFRHAGFGLPGF